MFRDLRNVGLFDIFKKQIRQKEIEVQGGWINPKLSDFGSFSEAPQYALTKEIDSNIGKCPFTGLYKS